MAVNEEISDPEEKIEGRRYSSFISFGNAMVNFSKKKKCLYCCISTYFDTVPIFFKLSFDQYLSCRTNRHHLTDFPGN